MRREVKIEGKLIRLEPLDIDRHLEGYYRVSLDSKVHEYVGNSVPESQEEIRDLLKIYQDRLYNWMIINQKTDQVIGIMRLSPPEKEGDCLIAGESQRLHSAYWRKGHMKEAKGLFYRHVFDDLGVDILYADVYEGNINSIKSLEASGYDLIDQSTGASPKTGQVCQVYIYELTKSRYQERWRHVDD